MNHFQNIWDFKNASKENLTQHAFDYLVGGADDLRTFNRNIEAYQHFQIRPRRLIDVTQVDTSIELFGKKYASPIFLAPVGFQKLFHEEGEIPAIKAAAAKNILSVASTV
ncbi:MAG: isopentenyl diphosphate isomerase/L-lactate dehydrogenase-like FMN-dependent dehydrogenase, partial [Granulosicoccus sp.]